MKKILNISTIISTGVLNFIKAADENNVSEKNIFLFIDGNEYKAKEEENEDVNIKDENSVLEVLKKRINNETISNNIWKKSIYDYYVESSIDGQNYTEVNWTNVKFLKINCFKKNVVEKNKLKINNNNFTGEKIQSLEILKMELKNFGKDLNHEKSKLITIYNFLNRNKIIEPNEIIVSYKINGNETKIHDFITIDDLEKIYKAISQKKPVDIVSKKIDINYCFNGRYGFNDKEFTEEQFNKLINLYKILASNLKYISFNSLTEEEVKNYLKNQYGINGEVIFKSDESGENVKYITLPDKYLLCKVNLYLKGKEIKGKTLKYDYLNQLNLNYFTIYPKGTKYSELDKYIKNQFKFLKDKEYSLYYDYDPYSLNIKINNDNEIEPGEIIICIDDNENNNDLYEAINDNIKRVGIFIFGKYYSFYLENVKNNNIIELLGKIIKSRENKIIDDFNLEFFNSKNEKLEIENNNIDLNKNFYTSENLIEINVNIKRLKNNKEDKKDDKDKDKGGTGQGNNTTQSTEGDVKKEKKCCCGCK